MGFLHVWSSFWIKNSQEKKEKSNSLFLKKEKEKSGVSAPASFDVATPLHTNILKNVEILIPLIDYKVIKIVEGYDVK